MNPRSFIRSATPSRITATLLSMVACSASAQAVDEPAPMPAADVTQAAADAIEEIVVTAQRRSERLVDVPISITAISSDTLDRAGVSSTLDLPLVTPGLEMPMYGAYTQPAIRGVSSAGSGLADSSNVAVYVDGVYQPSQSGQLADLPNVEDVQVLKGPQGTLYGQNATGGAIIINTIQPSFTPGGRLSASYGNYDRKAVSGNITGPLSSQLAGMLAASYENREGFNDDLLRGGHDKGLRSQQLRGKLLWQPAGDVSFTLGAFYTQRYDSTPYAGQPYQNISVGVPISEQLGLPVPTKPHQFAFSQEPDTRIRSSGLSLLGEIPVGELGKISTVTAYGEVKVANTQDIDSTGVNIAALTDFVVKQHDLIQEINFLSNKFGRLTTSAGLFYMYNTESFDPYTFEVYGGSAFPDEPEPVLTIGNYSQNKRNYYAGYIEGNYDISQTVMLTLGGRYSSERQKVYGSALPDSSKYPDPRGAFTFDKFTPRGVLSYKPNAAAMYYASVSQGFKSGFVDANAIYPCYDSEQGRAVQCAPPTDPVEPEVLTAYELGYKGHPIDALTLSVAAFHYDYKNLQVYIYQPTIGTGRYLNAAKARIDGIDFDASLKVSPDLTLSVGGVYMDAKYKSFPDAQAYVPYGSEVDGEPVTCAGGLPGGNCSLAVDAGGNRMMRAPKLTLAASADYQYHAGFGTVGASTNVKYNSGFYFDPVENIKQGDYVLLNGQIFVEPRSIPNVRLSLYGKNLTNEDYLSSVLESNLSNGVSYGAPREFGLTIDAHF